MAEREAKIVKLNGNNYQTWKYNVKLLLMNNGLWSYVKGLETKPEPTATDTKDKEIKEFLLKAQKAYSTIAINIESQLQVHVQETDDPKKAWELLENHFNFVSVTEVVRTNRAFYTAKMEEGGDVNEHITKMTQLSARLKELDDEVSSKKFATAVLGSLPESYEHFISSLNARDAASLDWNQIKPLLIEEYMSRNDKANDKSDRRSDRQEALMTRRNNGRNNNHRSGNNNFNDRSGSEFRGNSSRSNNFRDDSRNNGGDPRRNNNFNNFRDQASNRGPDFHHQQSNRSQGVTCYFCRQPGHKVSSCPDLNNNRNAEQGNVVMMGVKRSDDDNDHSNSPKKRKIEDVVPFCEDDVALTSSINEIKTGGNEWYIDSAASSHMVNKKEVLRDYKEYVTPSNVLLGDDTCIPAIGEGTIEFTSADKQYDLNLTPVLYVPALAKNLISVRSMTENEDTMVVFDRERCTVHKNNEIFDIGSISDKGKLYQMNYVPKDTISANVVVKTDKTSVDVWHRRLSHVNGKYMEIMAKNNLVDGYQINVNNVDLSCEPCILGKMTRNSCPKQSQNRATCVLEMIHTDVCGPMQVDSHGGSKYFVSFTDDYSRYTTVYFMKKKSEVLEKFKEFAQLVENKTNMRIRKLNIWNSVKSVRSDNGGEYTSSAFDAFCTEKGISREFTNAYTPEQNGVSERLNRTIIEAVRSMLIHSNLTPDFWAEAVQTAVYVQNRVPTSALGNEITPYECWFGRKPDISNLRVFGCICYYHVPDERRKKLDPKARKAIFLGYPEGVKGYKVMDVESGKFVKTRNIRFHEEEFRMSEKHDSNMKFTEKLVVFPDDSTEENIDAVRDAIAVPPVVEEVRDEVPPVHTNNVNNDAGTTVNPPHTNPVGAVHETYEKTFLESVKNIEEKRSRKPPSRLIEESNITELCKNIEKNMCFSAESLIADIDEPRSLKNALESENAKEWKAAMDKEYQSLLENETWDLVRRPEGVNVVNNRWVFKIKRKPDGSIDRFKARLVAQGFSQTHGVDYEEVFSPVARSESIRSLLALGNTFDLEIHQMDVCTAFLNGELDCDVYMEQPKGYSNGDPDMVCKLKKGLYGLKQASRCWNKTLDDYMKSRDYRVCSADGCVYIKTETREDGSLKFVIFPFYVDDSMPISNDIEWMKQEKAAIAQRFKLVDNGEISHVLGLMIKRDRSRKILTISQPMYVQEVLERFRMDQCNPVSTPLETGRQFTKTDMQNDVQFDKEVYQQAIGCLTYLSTNTRPDISAAVSALSQHMSNPSSDHWSGVKRVFRYLKGTIDYGLVFSAGDGVLHGYCDADWAGDIDNRRSTSGYVFRIGDATVSWSCQKQKTVARSSTEAEYVSLSYATQEAVWLRRLMDDLGFGTQAPMKMYEDNNGAIELTKNAKHHNRTKHIDIAHHFVREKVEEKEIVVTHCPSKEMTADIMTKGIPRVQFEKLRDLMGVGCAKM